MDILHWILRIAWVVLVGLTVAYLNVRDLFDAGMAGMATVTMRDARIFGEAGAFDGYWGWLWAHISGSSPLSLGRLLLLASGGPMMRKLIAFAVLGGGLWFLNQVFAPSIEPESEEEEGSTAM